MEGKVEHEMVNAMETRLPSGLWGLCTVGA